MESLMVTERAVRRRRSSATEAQMAGYGPLHDAESAATAATQRERERDTYGGGSWKRRTHPAGAGGGSPNTSVRAASHRTLAGTLDLAEVQRWLSQPADRLAGGLPTGRPRLNSRWGGGTAVSARSNSGSDNGDAVPAERSVRIPPVAQAHVLSARSLRFPSASAEGRFRAHYAQTTPQRFRVLLVIGFLVAIANVAWLFVRKGLKIPVSSIAPWASFGLLLVASFGALFLRRVRAMPHRPLWTSLSLVTTLGYGLLCVQKGYATAGEFTTIGPMVIFVYLSALHVPLRRSLPWVALMVAAELAACLAGTGSSWGEVVGVVFFFAYADIVLLSVVFAYIYEDTARRTFVLGNMTEAARQAAQQQASRSDLILRNILPDPIIAAIKRSQWELINRRYDQLTVLFCHLSFPQDELGGSIEGSNARNFIAWANRMFNRLEALADAHGVQKIKTIGASMFMAVAGLDLEKGPKGQHHTQAAASFGLDALQAAGSMGIRLQIGAHCGPAVAGMIGCRLFFDCFGDSVNTAQRMCTHGQPGRMHVSSAFRDALYPLGSHAFSAGHEIAVKGKGTMKCYFVGGDARPEPGAPSAPALVSDVPPSVPVQTLPVVVLSASSAADLSPASSVAGPVLHHDGPAPGPPSGRQRASPLPASLPPLPRHAAVPAAPALRRLAAADARWSPEAFILRRQVEAGAEPLATARRHAAAQGVAPGSGSPRPPSNASSGVLLARRSMEEAIPAPPPAAEPAEGSARGPRFSASFQRRARAEPGASEPATPRTRRESVVPPSAAAAGGAAPAAAEAAGSDAEPPAVKGPAPPSFSGLFWGAAAVAPAPATAMPSPSMSPNPGANRQRRASLAAAAMMEQFQSQQARGQLFAAAEAARPWWSMHFKDKEAEQGYTLQREAGGLLGTRKMVLLAAVHNVTWPIFEWALGGATSVAGAAGLDRRLYLRYGLVVPLLAAVAAVSFWRPQALRVQQIARRSMFFVLLALMGAKWGLETSQLSSYTVRSMTDADAVVLIILCNAPSASFYEAQLYCFGVFLVSFLGLVGRMNGLSPVFAALTALAAGAVSFFREKESRRAFLSELAAQRETDRLTQEGRDTNGLLDLCMPPPVVDVLHAHGARAAAEPGHAVPSPRRDGPPLKPSSWTEPEAAPSPRPAPETGAVSAGELREATVLSYKRVAVLCSDIVGFTELSARLSAEELVGMLNELFTACDEIAAAHGVTTLKTIGDAWMGVVGIHDGGASDADVVAILRAACEMADVYDDTCVPGTQQPLRVRIGIAVGSAAGGIIGAKRWCGPVAKWARQDSNPGRRIWDMFGPAVDGAMEMEHTGVPGLVQVTPDVARIVRGATGPNVFAFTPAVRLPQNSNSSGEKLVSVRGTTQRENGSSPASPSSTPFFVALHREGPRPVSASLDIDG